MTTPDLIDAADEAAAFLLESRLVAARESPCVALRRNIRDEPSAHAERSWTIPVEVIKIAGSKSHPRSRPLTLLAAPAPARWHRTSRRGDRRNTEAVPIQLAKGENKAESYLKINSRGKVPALSAGKDDH
jgi:hypothetical protein